MKKFLLAALLLAIVAFWGATFLIVKQATREFSVLGFLGLRFGLATVCMGLFAVWRLDLKALRIGMLIGLVLAISYLFQTYGLRFTTSTNVGLITGMFIIFVPWTNRLLFGVRTGLWAWLGILVSVVGLLFLTGSATTWQRGDALSFLCAACFGLQVTLLDHYAPRHSSLSLSLGQMAAVCAICLVAWVVMEGNSVAMPNKTVGTAIVATGVIGSALAFFIQTVAQKHLSAIETGTIIMTEPVFAAIVGRYWGHELLSGLQWFGGGLMMLAMAIVSLQPLLEQKMRRPAAAVTSSD